MIRTVGGRYNVSGIVTLHTTVYQDNLYLAFVSLHTNTGRKNTSRLMRANEPMYLPHPKLFEKCVALLDNDRVIHTYTRHVV